MFKVEDLLKATAGRLISGPGGAQVKSVSIDSRAVKSAEAFIAIKGERFDGHDFIREVIKKGVKVIIAHRKLNVDKSVSVILVKDTVKALGDIARFNRRRFNIPVIAVTGSNGKTTSKDMIAWVLGAKYKVLKNLGTKNNHIGLPQTLLGLDKTYDCAVLEIGTNHFGEVGYLARICEPNIGVVTNIGPSHLEFLKGLSGVYREKYSLIKNLKRPRIAVLNSDDKFLAKHLKKKEKLSFNIGAGINAVSDYRGASLEVKNAKTRFVVNKKYKFTLNTSGSYNIHNALQAIAIARIFGLDYKVIAQRLKNFQFPKGRLNLIEVGGIRFIDDTYNSNPLSLKCALEALKGIRASGKFMIMGDMLELGKGSEEFHAGAVRLALEACDCLITVGRHSRQACKNIKSGNKKIFSCENSTHARELLLGLKPGKGDIVLVKGSRAIKLEEVFKI
ncbi:MAG: UDP-N-acetylmuramoyl-tripeptide--D-alanyl-D-alanine ligase [Candidatus Omnitrophica bacterium]|nr:UDP-N-acetylmuramoyl-tripeptide--D-alanyl-D-alanine ligase [Candidatus Omnitrophota bacterium]